MIPALREEFNRKFLEEKYNAVRQTLEKECGCIVDFRLAESPLFIPKDLARRAGKLAEAMLLAAASPELQAGAAHAIPPEFVIPGENPHPNFAAVDFAITGSAESPELKLIELQGFPSLFYFQAAYSQLVRDIYDLPHDLTGLIYHDETYQRYGEQLRRVIVGDEDPRHVVLLELDPYRQKTVADFTLTEKAVGIRICNVLDLVQQGDKLYYPDKGDLVEIKRIYNRTIYDELKAKRIELPVDLTRPLRVTWAGHPNWYYRISKILLPELSRKFEAVPKGYLLSELPFDVREIDLEKYVLKPLFSFAGSGVVVGPTAEDVAMVAEDRLDKWMLQERVEYAEAFKTPSGHGVKAELRVLMLWPDDDDTPTAAHTLVRLTRGKMVGVDFNKGLDWVGSSCALVG